MKSLIMIIPILFSIACFSQQPYHNLSLNNAVKDTTGRRDTIRVIQREVRDTIKAKILYADASGFVKYTEGYAIRLGLTEDGKKFVKAPKIIGCLDDKKKELKKWLHLL